MEAPPRDPEVASSDIAELHLLIGEMKDELSAYRWREAVWISIVFHVLIFLGLIFVPQWIPKGAIIIPAVDQTKDITFVAGPNDTQHVRAPKTDILSDKNRIAQARNPVVDKNTLRRLLDMQRPGPPAQAPRPAPTQQAMQQSPQQANPESQNGSQNPMQAPPQPTQQAQLQTPQQSRGPVNFQTHAPGLEQAIQSAASNHGANHMAFGGDYGSNRLQPNTNVRGDVDILSDTMGVDFGPYLQKVLFEIKRHWYDLIPEVARPPIMKRGKLTVEFAINKDGSVAGLRYVQTSGDIALDRPAYGSITASDPFPRLPGEFKGNYIALRIRFYYNPDPRTDDLN